MWCLVVLLQGEQAGYRPPRRRHDVCQIDAHTDQLTRLHAHGRVPKPTPDITQTARTSSLSTRRRSFFGKRRRAPSRCICATDTTFVGVSSGVLSLVYCEKGDYANLFTKACRPSRLNVSHFFDETPMLLPFLSTRNTTSPSCSTTQTLTMVEALSYFCFVRL